MHRRNSGKWIVRSLERHWGEEVVKKDYERIAKKMKERASSSSVASSLGQKENRARMETKSLSANSFSPFRKGKGARGD